MGWKTNQPRSGGRESLREGFRMHALELLNSSGNLRTKWRTTKPGMGHGALYRWRLFHRLGQQLDIRRDCQGLAAPVRHQGSESLPCAFKSL